MRQERDGGRGWGEAGRGPHPLGQGCSAGLSKIEPILKASRMADAATSPQGRPPFEAASCCAMAWTFAMAAGSKKPARAGGTEGAAGGTRAHSNAQLERWGGHSSLRCV